MGYLNKRFRLAGWHKPHLSESGRGAGPADTPRPGLLRRVWIAGAVAIPAAMYAKGRNESERM